MKKLVIGLFFITLNISVIVNGIVIGLIPSFIGYLFLIGGLREVSEDNKSFEKARKLCFPLAAVTLILYVFNIFGFSYSDGESVNIPAFAAELLCAAGELYVAYQICLGTAELEANHNCDLNSDKLKLAWTIMAISLACAYITVAIPVISACCVMISFAFAIVFLLQFNTARLRYNNIFHKD